MMAKIVKGSDFKGVVDYILDKDKNAQVVAYEGLFMENKDTIAMSFNVQWQMNNKVAKPVVHIALSFSKEDESRLTNRVMAGGKSSVSCPLKPSDSAPLKHSTMPP